MKTIFNTYIEVTSQEQADRLKQICIDNNLPIWKNKRAFLLEYDLKDYCFCYFDISSVFFVMPIDKDNIDKVTESEWFKLLKQHKCTE